MRKISSVFFKMAYVKGQSSENTFFMHLKIIAYLLLNICSYSLLEKKLYYDTIFSKVENTPTAIQKGYETYIKAIFYRKRQWRKNYPINYARFLRDLEKYEILPSWYT